MTNYDDDDLASWEAERKARPTLLEERGHPNHWFNRASDLRASAGALWLAMHNDADDGGVECLRLGPSFSMSVACNPVYHMLCGLALELVMKARLAQMGKSQSQMETHSFTRLLELLDVHPYPAERKLLSFYENCLVWAGRYPLPRNPSETKLKQFWDAADDVLTEPVPGIRGIQVRRGNGATSWQNFHTLWQKYAALFERRGI